MEVMDVELFYFDTVLGMQKYSVIIKMLQNSTKFHFSLGWN